MVCDRVPIPGGGFAIVCSRGPRRRAQPCAWCRPLVPSPFLCDWKLVKRKTCSKPICAEHAFEAAPDRHLCPGHVEIYRAWLREQAIAYG